MGNSRWEPFDERTIRPGLYMIYSSKERGERGPYLTGNFALMKVQASANGSPICIVDGCFLWDTTEPDIVRFFDPSEELEDMPIKAEE